MDFPVTENEVKLDIFNKFIFLNNDLDNVLSRDSGSIPAANWY